MGKGNVEIDQSDEEEEEKKVKDVSVSYKSTRSGKSDGPADMGATATFQLGIYLCFNFKRFNTSSSFGDCLSIGVMLRTGAWCS